MNDLQKMIAAMLTVVCAPGAALAADAVLPAFDPADFAAPMANPYVPLTVGQSHRFGGAHVDAGKQIAEESTWVVQGPGPVILGVPTVLVLDEAFENGALVERTMDYYATDLHGNLWYFGEDVTNFRYDEAGKLTGTDSKSAWRAGENGAKPGISVPGAPTAGLKQFQEYAEQDKAMDYFEVLATDETVSGPSGSYQKVLKTFEGSAADPDLREFKYYAPGVGLIRADEELSPALDNPAVVVEMLP